MDKSVINPPSPYKGNIKCIISQEALAVAYLKLLNANPLIWIWLQAYNDFTYRC